MASIRKVPERISIEDLTSAELLVIRNALFTYATAGVSDAVNDASHGCARMSRETGGEPQWAIAKRLQQGLGR